MSYIIDFRIRPPYKNFLNSGIFKCWEFESPETMTAIQIGRKPIPSAREGDMDMFIREMDDAGIVSSVIMGRRTGDAALGSGSVDNAEIKELMDKYPGRFYGFAGIDPTEAGALADIERCHSWGFKGVSVEPAWLNPNMYADDPRIFPVYDLCNDLGMVLNLTVSAFVGPDITYCDPVHIQHVAQRYPKMNIVVTHAAWPNIDKLLGVCLTCMNVYIAPDCYFYVENMPFGDQLVRAGNGFMRHRMLFNSSYPVRGLRQSVETWADKGLDPDALERQYYWNAKRLLGL